MEFLATAGSGTLQQLMSAATEMLSWFITSMSSLVGFITDNPIVLTYFLIALVGAVVGMFMRIWKSA